MAGEKLPFSKRALFICGAALLSLTISYVLLELGAAWLVYGTGRYLSCLDSEHYVGLMNEDPPWGFDKPMHTFDEQSGIIHTPANFGFWRYLSYPKAEFRNWILINADGFRSSKDYGPGPGARVAVLGDSFVEAFQVREEDSLVKVAEKSLRQRGYPAEVLNYGICSTGTVHQAGIMEKYALRSRPKAVVLAWFPNDLIDNSPAYWHERGALVPRYTFDPSGDVRMETFAMDTPVAAEPTEVLNPGPSGPGRRMLEALASVLHRAKFSLSLRFLGALIQDKLLPNLVYERAFDIYKKDYGPALKESLRVTAALIQQMDRRCREEGVQFLVMLIPALEQMEPAQFQQYIRARRGALAEGDFDISTPQKLMRRELSARGVRFFDLWPYFDNPQDRAKLYYPKDRHFNVRGHLRTGQILADKLEPLLK